MNTNRPIKAIGAGAVALFLVAGVALGADAILRAPTPTRTVILAADETSTPGAAGTAEPNETLEPEETAEPSGDARGGRDRGARGDRRAEGDRRAQGDRRGR